MPDIDDSFRVDLGKARVARADRYFGNGVGYCGGNARCGLVSKVQVKGSGRNLLHGIKLGSNLEAGRSSGIMSLADAAREAVWSGICEKVLPFGAVRSLGIIGNRPKLRIEKNRRSNPISAGFTLAIICF